MVTTISAGIEPSANDFYPDSSVRLFASSNLKQEFMKPDYKKFHRLLKILIAIFFTGTLAINFAPRHYSWFYWRQLVLEWLIFVTVVLIFSSLLYWITTFIFPRLTAQFGADFDLNTKVPRRFVLLCVAVSLVYFSSVFRIVAVYRSPAVVCEIVINETRQIKILNYSLNNKMIYSSRDFFLTSADNGETWEQFGHHAGRMEFISLDKNGGCQLEKSVKENRLWLKHHGHLLQSDLNGENWEFIELLD